MSASEKTGQVRIRQVPVSAIRPSPQNDLLYRPVDPADPDFQGLVDSVRRLGIKEPLVVSLDWFILSGHRRHAAARAAGLRTVPCRTEDVWSGDPGFVELLREYNRQRVKSLDEVLREEVVSADPEEAYRALVEYRQAKARVDVDLEVIEIRGRTHRSRISEAKRPMLDAVLAVLRERQEFLPLTLRQVHYALLNDPPLKHASKPDSRYRNDQPSYKNLSDLLIRARLAEVIPWEAIEDGTRPMCTWSDCHRGPASFIREQLDHFLKGYYRDLQASQPNHVEIIGEKNTVEGIIRPVACDFCIPFTLGRGYCSSPPREKMAKRFRSSGKERLVLLVLSDFDPEGEDIGHSFARSMRDDFGVRKIEPIKVALTRQQVHALNLPPVMKAKQTSSRHAGFVGKHGDDVFELEAVPPGQLQGILRHAIDSVLDVEAFNREVALEREEAAQIAGVRRRLAGSLSGLGLLGPDDQGAEG